jgi:hypothetical protein
MTTAETQVLQEEDHSQMASNDYLVCGRLDGWSNDIVEYVQAPTAVEAEDIFRDWILDKYQSAGVEVFFESVIQISGPPIAIFDEEGVRENIQPIQRPS